MYIQVNGYDLIIKKSVDSLDHIHCSSDGIFYWYQDQEKRVKSQFKCDKPALELNVYDLELIFSDFLVKSEYCIKFKCKYLDCDFIASFQVYAKDIIEAINAFIVWNNKTHGNPATILSVELVKKEQSLEP